MVALQAIICCGCAASFIPAADPDARAALNISRNTSVTVLKAVSVYILLYY